MGKHSSRRWRRELEQANRICESQSFDRDWYLATNPDVAAAGMDPWRHFVLFGQHEGRLPYRNQAIPLDFHLWREQGTLMVSRLQHLMQSAQALPHERDHAAWALARWHAAYDRWDEAKALLFRDGELITQPNTAGLYQLTLMVVAHAAAQEDDQDLWEQIERRIESCGDPITVALGKAYIALVKNQDEAGWLVAINRMWGSASLRPVTLLKSRQNTLFDGLATADNPSPRRWWKKTPLVSVVVPVRNVAATLRTAVIGLYKQIWPRLELIIVDDGSDDDTGKVINELKAQAPRHVEVVSVNMESAKGAYAARNEGVARARGDFITVHDGDDWSHPQKIALHVRALEKNRRAYACMSEWLRVTPSLEFFQWRVEESGWVHPNVSSLMVRRQVIDDLGYWDNVKVNADSEYVERIKAAYGANAIIAVCPGVPLAFGRVSPTSLSQHPDTHVITQFGGARADYMAFASHWHQRAQQQKPLLYMEKEPHQRKFPAPVALLLHASRGNEVVQDDRDRIVLSGLFDQGWYLRRYIELQGIRVNAFEHYWALGRFNGFDPGPAFSQSAYSRAQRIAPDEALTAFLHPSKNHHVATVPWEMTTGVEDATAATLLLCGHRAEKELYGAERCLLDQAGASRQLGYNVVVTLPSAINADYCHGFESLGCTVVILPYGWWQQGAGSELVTVSYFEQLIQRHAIDAVLANTIMLDEPLVAAQRAGCKTLIYVHELPEFSPALCDAANASPHALLAHADSLADVLLANSWHTAQATGQMLGDEAESNIDVIPDTVDMQTLLSLPPLVPAHPMVISIIASGSVNKGLEDLPTLCEVLGNQAAAVHIHLYVAESPWLSQLVTQCKQLNTHIDIMIRGYTENIAAALEESSIVLSLSRFQESFGRTALEAMAAARPFVGYAWGALPEVIEDGETGWLVPYGDIEALANVLSEHLHNVDELLQVGLKGRQRAIEQYGWARYIAHTQAVFSKWLQ